MQLLLETLTLNKKTSILVLLLGYTVLAAYALLIFLEDRAIEKSQAPKVPQQQNYMKYIENTALVSSHKNIFGQYKNEVAEFKPGQWKLVGVILQDTENPKAIINIDNQDKIFGINDSIEQNIKIQNIEKERIVILHHQEIKHLLLFSQFDSPPPKQPNANALEGFGGLAAKMRKQFSK